MAFPLWLNKTAVKNIKQLRKNFDIISLKGYYLSGSLYSWLLSIGEKDLAKKVQNIKDTAPEKKLCEIFGVDYSKVSVKTTGKSLDFNHINLGNVKGGSHESGVVGIKVGSGRYDFGFLDTDTGSGMYTSGISSFDYGFDLGSGIYTSGMFSYEFEFGSGMNTSGTFLYEFEFGSGIDTSGMYLYEFEYGSGIDTSGMYLQEYGSGIDTSGIYLQEYGSGIDVIDGSGIAVISGEDDIKTPQGKKSFTPKGIIKEIEAARKKLMYMGYGLHMILIGDCESDEKTALFEIRPDIGEEADNPNVKRRIRGK